MNTPTPPTTPALAGQPGELRFTVEVKRAATGLVERHELIGVIDPEQLKQLQAAGLVHQPQEQQA
jgi:DNA-binding transcriptional regulator YdaS (Cro superfamily)